MNNKCHCYHKQPKTRYTYHPITGSPIGNNIMVGVCWGTKETEECSCGGDETKCDFYPDVRAKAKKKTKKNITIEDAIEHFKYGISHDIFSEPVTTYAEMAIEALEKQLKDEDDGYWFLLDDCANEGVYCSKCRKKVYKKDYANQKLKSKFCPNCGKKMSGEFRTLY